MQQYLRKELINRGYPNAEKPSPAQTMGDTIAFPRLRPGAAVVTNDPSSLYYNTDMIEQVAIQFPLTPEGIRRMDTGQIECLWRYLHRYNHMMPRIKVEVHRDIRTLTTQVNMTARTLISKDIYVSHAVPDEMLDDMMALHSARLRMVHVLAEPYLDATQEHLLACMVACQERAITLKIDLEKHT